MIAIINIRNTKEEIFLVAFMALLLGGAKKISRKSVRIDCEEDARIFYSCARE